jgi:hypothetical protein
VGVIKWVAGSVCVGDCDSRVFVGVSGWTGLIGSEGVSVAGCDSVRGREWGRGFELFAGLVGVSGWM